MRGSIVGVAIGALVALAFLLIAGVGQRYVFGPALSPFGDPAFFTDMSTGGVLVLVLVRVVASWLGSVVAVRLSDEPHATWTGPFVVMVCALTTLVLMGMSQPIWSLLLTAVLVFAIGWVVGRRHVGMTVLPGGFAGRFGPSQDD